MNIETTKHRLVAGDARNLSFIPSESAHLILTSPPYWNLKRYNELPNQLGHIEDYELFLSELNKVLMECYRVLVPGGRLVCVVGDVLLSRKKHGKHVVMPLHSDITVLCRKIGFDNLSPIIWYKIGNITYEVDNGSKFLGQPYQPNAIIKSDIEFILMQRKSGGYRKPTPVQVEKSRLSKQEYQEWFRQIWDIPGESTKSHPAPFPLELAYRLVRMFSFYNDIVLDPFCGTGTTNVAAFRSNRHSIGVDIDPSYIKIAEARLKNELSTLSRKAELMTGSR